MRTRSIGVVALLLASTLATSAVRAQPAAEEDPEEPSQPPRASLPEAPAEEQAIDPERVARSSERLRVAMPDVDLELLQGSSRARALDARRRRLMWYGLFQGGLVLALLPYAINTIRDTHDPVIRTVTSSWIALGSGIVMVTGMIGGRATLLESRLYRCNHQETPRRFGRTAIALAAIPGIGMMSPYFGHRQHELNEATRMCELRETLRRRRIHIISEDDRDSETIGEPE